MNDQQLAIYSKYFLKLRRDYRFGGAPHKPVLLLSIAELVKRGEISENRIRITPELVLEFKNNWSKLVVTPHQPNFALPFFHLRSEPFWKLVPFAGMQIGVTGSASVKSFRNLKDTVAYAEMDMELFLLLNDPVSNAVLEQTLLDAYFPETKGKWREMDPYTIGSEISKQIISDTSLIYRKRIEELQRKLSRDAFEEEMFVRGGAFKREIPRYYGYRCAISGLRVETSYTIQLVDACHIIPFSESGDDTISNGICLTPTLHRAFDRGVITIDQQYRVRVSSLMKENESPYSIGQFHGKQILLPEKQFYPSLENLSKHSAKWIVS